LVVRLERSTLPLAEHVVLLITSELWIFMLNPPGSMGSIIELEARIICSRVGGRSRAKAHLPLVVFCNRLLDRIGVAG